LLDVGTYIGTVCRDNVVPDHGVRDENVFCDKADNVVNVQFFTAKRTRYFRRIIRVIERKRKDNRTVGRFDEL